MDEDKKNFRILWKLMLQRSHKIESGVTTIHRHRAAQSSDTCFLSVFRRPCRCTSAFQRRYSFLAAPLLSKANGFVGCYR